MPPPVRPAPDAYHYHTYDYPGSVAPFQPSAGQPSAGGFQFYSLVQDLNGLMAIGGVNNVPNLALTQMSLVPGGAQTVGAREVLMLSFGPAPGVANAPAVVITGGIHAREWIAAEIVYLLAEYLIIHYTDAPANAYQRMIRKLIRSRRIYIIPMLNPDGNEFSVFTAGGAGRDWRKNCRVLPVTPPAWVQELTGGGGPNPPPFTNVNAPAGGLMARYGVPNYDPGAGIPPNPVPPAGRNVRALAPGQIGVDLNRNLPTQGWGYDTATNGVMRGFDPMTELYFGPRASSEAETADVQLALQTANAAAGPAGIATTLDYHSFAKKILYPSEGYHNGGIWPDYKMLGKMLRQLIRSQAALDYQVGSSLQLIGYDATGSVPDRIFEQYQARAFTIELDPGYGTVGGFMLAEQHIQGVFEKNIRGALAAIAAPQRPGNIHASRLQRPPILATMLKLSTWDVYGRGNQLPQ
jgi:Zinc carboxypeptidase